MPRDFIFPSFSHNSDTGCTLTRLCLHYKCSSSTFTKEISCITVEDFMSGAPHLSIFCQSNYRVIWYRSCSNWGQLSSLLNFSLSSKPFPSSFSLLHINPHISQKMVLLYAFLRLWYTWVVFSTSFLNISAFILLLSLRKGRSLIFLSLLLALIGSTGLYLLFLDDFLSATLLWLGIFNLSLWDPSHLQLDLLPAKKMVFCFL